MDNEKCFCHLNGYAVKDATARRQIEELNEKIDTTLSEEQITQKINTAIDIAINGALEGVY